MRATPQEQIQMTEWLRGRGVSAPQERTGVMIAGSASHLHRPTGRATTEDLGIMRAQLAGFVGVLRSDGTRTDAYGRAVRDFAPGAPRSSSRPATREDVLRATMSEVARIVAGSRRSAAAPATRSELVAALRYEVARALKR